MHRTSESAPADAQADIGVPLSASSGTEPGSPPRRWQHWMRARVTSRLQPWLQPWLATWLKRGWRSLLVELVLLVVGVWAAANLVYVTTYGGTVPNHDVHEYQHYALLFWITPPLFHHLPVEYPPLSIIPFTLTLLPPFLDPLVVFTFWMGVLFIAGYLWFLRYADRRRAITYAVYLLVGAASTVFARFDLVPALVTLLALAAAERRRFSWAYLLLAAGILLKLYPAFLVPLVAIEQWRLLAQRTPATPRRESRDAIQHSRVQSRMVAPALATVRAWLASVLGAVDRQAAREVVRGVGLCVLVVVLGFGVAALLSPAGALSGFSYAGSRPLQVESTPASLLWIGSWFGFPAHAVYTYQSLNLVGPLDHLLEPLSALALAGGCLLVYWRQWRGRLDVGHAFVACVCVVLVTNKIFSPQYLIWALPLVAYVMGFDVLWLVVGLLTTAIYPFLYFAHGHILLVAQDWRFLPVIALRNALLVVVTVRSLASHAQKTRMGGEMAQRLGILWQRWASGALGQGG